MRSPVDDIRLAFALLTVVPVRADMPTEGERGHTADYFVLVGAVFGLLGVGVAALPAAGIVLQPTLVAAVIVLGWALLSRGLHWDGLADVADGLGARPERRLEAMKDSTTGAFGVLTIVGVFALQTLSLGAVLEAWPEALAVVGLVPVFGRLAASCAAWLGRPLAPGGLGASVMGRPSGVGLAFTAVLLGGLLFAAAQLSVLLAALLAVTGIGAALVVPHLIAGRIGGVNGDVMGASVLVTETVVLLASAVAVVLMVSFYA